MTRALRNFSGLLAALALGACHGTSAVVDAGFDAGPSETACGWTQWGQNPAHTGQACAAANPIVNPLATVTFDPNALAEQADAQGDLVAHYGTPLVLGDDVYMEQKGGLWLACEPPGSGKLADGGACGRDVWQTQTWSEAHYAWQSGALVLRHTLLSDWTPPTDALTTFEPVFAAAISADSLFMPGAGGTVHVIDRRTDTEALRLDPFAPTDGGAPSIDPTRFVVSPLTVDTQGRVLWTVLQVGNPDPFSVAEGWLVRGDAQGHVQKASFQDLTPGAPASTDLCPVGFSYNEDALPWPPVDDAGNPKPTRTATCLEQRPTINAAPAVGPDGTIYVVSRAHGSERTALLVAVNDDLTPRWTASLAGHLHDGCGVGVPSDVDSAGDLPDGGSHLSHCRIGAAQGVDPATNAQPAGMADDSSSSSPVVLPDGSVIYGALTYYNNDRGHLMKFSSSGQFQGSYDFGWDDTPAVWGHDGTYSIVTKDNHYFNYNSAAAGPYDITQLDPNLVPEWKFESTDTLNCFRQSDGSVTCSPQRCDDLGDGGQSCYASNPDGFEWCVNAPAVDPGGNIYANSEDGRVYAISQGGTEKAHVFLQESVGAAYTPVTIDGSGRVYSLNGGVMTVLGP